MVDAGPAGGGRYGSVGGVSAQEDPGPGAAWEDVTRGMVSQGGAGRRSRGAVAS